MTRKIFQKTLRYGICKQKKNFLPQLSWTFNCLHAWDFQALWFHTYIWLFLPSETSACHSDIWWRRIFDRWLPSALYPDDLSLMLDLKRKITVKLYVKYNSAPSAWKFIFVFDSKYTKLGLLTFTPLIVNIPEIVHAYRSRAVTHSEFQWCCWMRQPTK